MSTQTVSAFRLSTQQERLWLQQSGSAAPFRSVCEMLLEGSLDIARLQAAVALVIERHEILRTVFHRQAGVMLPFQVIAESLEAAWPRGDLNAVEGPAQSAGLCRDSFAAFDLE